MIGGRILEDVLALEIRELAGSAEVDARLADPLLCVRDLRAGPRTSLAALAVVIREIRRLADAVLPGPVG